VWFEKGTVLRREKESSGRWRERDTAKKRERK
jgi:hypothetical protein